MAGLARRRFWHYVIRGIVHVQRGEVAMNHAPGPKDLAWQRSTLFIRTLDMLQVDWVVCGRLVVPFANTDNADALLAAI